MIDFKAVLKLASAPHSVPLMGCVAFDGRNAIALANSRDPQPWWAAVPFPVDGLAGPVAVPVGAIKAHQLRSRHLLVAADHLHNGQGLRTDWDKKTDWSDALTLLPHEPPGVPAMFDLDLDSLDRVLVAAGENDIRGAFNGVLLDCSTGRMVATDGHRLHLFERRLPKLLPKKGQGPLHVILPKAAGKWLLHSSDAIAQVSVWGIGSDCPLVLMRCTDGMVFTQAIAATYPEYTRVVPGRASFRQVMEVNPAEFADGVSAMAKVHALDKPKLLSVGVHWAEGRIYAGPGPAFVPFTCNFRTEATGSPVTEGLWAYFTPQYLQDAADCVTAAAEWGAQPDMGNSSLSLWEGDFQAVVMPQRMKDCPPPSDKAGEPADPSESAKPATVAGKGQKPTHGVGKRPAKPPKAGNSGSAAPAGHSPGPEPARGPEKAPETVPVAPPVPGPSAGPENPPKVLETAPPKAPEPAKPPRIRRALKGQTLH